MNKRQLIFAWGIILLISNACFAKEDITPGFINGITTQQQVIDDFRGPDEVTKDEYGNTVWIFKDAVEIENADTGQEYPDYLLVLTFDRYGILIKTGIWPVSDFEVKE
jgi:hypothetical protein